jgi:hypothetical protein
LIAVFRITSRTLRPSGIGTRRFRMKASGLGPPGGGGVALLPPFGPLRETSFSSGADEASAKSRLGEYSSDGVETHMCAPGDFAVLGTSFAW